MKVNQPEILKKTKSFEFDNDKVGLCYVNTSKGQVNSMLDNSEITKKANKIAEMNQCYKGINSQFVSFFYKRKSPELVSIKTKAENRFIKFLDSEHIIFAISEEEEVNYARMKIQLSNINV